MQSEDYALDTLLISQSSRGQIFVVASDGNINKIDYISSLASRRSYGYKEYLFTNVDARIAGSVAGRTGLAERRKSR